MTEYEQTLAKLEELLIDSAEKAKALVEQFVTWYTETLPDVIRYVVENFPYLIRGSQSELLDLCPNRRVVHLARHGKKYRTRKKNRRRVYNLIWEVPKK